MSMEDSLRQLDQSLLGRNVKLKFLSLALEDSMRLSELFNCESILGIAQDICIQVNWLHADVKLPSKGFRRVHEEFGEGEECKPWELHIRKDKLKLMIVSKFTIRTLN